MEYSENNCSRIFIFGAISIVLTALAFYSGVNAIGIILVATAIASFGFGAGSIMNSPEQHHH